MDSADTSQWCQFTVVATAVHQAHPAAAVQVAGVGLDHMEDFADILHVVGVHNLQRVGTEVAVDSHHIVDHQQVVPIDRHHYRNLNLDISLIVSKR